MTQDKLDTLITTIDIQHTKGATIISITGVEMLKEVLNIQNQTDAKSTLVNIGQKLTIDGKKYIVKSVDFKVQEFSMETGTTPGANMYAENYSTDSNLKIRVVVDNVV